MEKKQLRKYGNVLLKILGTGLAIYFVTRKINFSDLTATLSKVHLAWLIAALLLYNVSKIISAFRLNILFKAINIHLTEVFNIRLYYFGMFLNLFLPGGIGGDGYKAYYLTKRHDTSTKLIIASILKDRISGLAALVVLALLIYVGIHRFFSWEFQYVWHIALACLILCLPCYYLFTRLYFPSFISAYFKTTAYSFAVQIVQLICAFCLLLSLNVEGQFWIYLNLFLVSSIVTIIPVTIGGLGMRETVFLLAADMVGIDVNKAVSLGFLFFLITAVSSLLGVFVKLKDETVNSTN